MKRMFPLWYLLLFVCCSCKKDKIEDVRCVNDTLAQYNCDSSYLLTNISYGNDAEQIMDLYLPNNRMPNKTKIFVIVHGGGWYAGDKENLRYLFDSLRNSYHNIAIANINYRLATTSSPGNPKQLEDIDSAIMFLTKNHFNLSPHFFFAGSSAGAHLCMLFAYKNPYNVQIDGVCSYVGFTDLVDTCYTNYASINSKFIYLLGYVSYYTNPEAFREVSPINYLKVSSPPIIMFSGSRDSQVPLNEYIVMKRKMDSLGIYNEAYVYNEEHGGWSEANMADRYAKMKAFM